MPDTSESHRKPLLALLVAAVVGVAAVAMTRRRRLGEAQELAGAPRQPAGKEREPAAPDAGSTRRRGAQEARSLPVRFAVATLFAVLFFAGAALSALAGDELQQLTAGADATGTTASSSTEAATTTAPVDPAAAPPDTSTTTAGTAPAPEAGDASVPPAPVFSYSPPAVDVATQRAPHAAATRPPARRHRTRIVRAHAAAPVRAPKPSNEQTGGAGTAPRPGGPIMWLSGPPPAPTPPALRLPRALTRQVVAAARAAHADWSLVLGVLQTERAGLASARTKARRTAAVAARDAAGAERVVALARLDRAVGVETLVRGLAASKRRLEHRVLADPRARIYGSGRADIAAGRVDPRVLTVIAYLGQTFGGVEVSSLVSGHRRDARPGVLSAHVVGRAVDVVALGGVPIMGHQQPGGITERAIRALLLLPPGLEPAQIISLLGLGGPSFPLPDHYDHIHIGY